MDMIARKKWLMMMQSSVTELYSIGTDVVDVYIRQPNNWQAGYIINANGEYVAGTASDYYASSIYIPVNPLYTYRKNAYRIGNPQGGYAAWYDKNKTFISTFKQDNLTAGDLPQLPSNAAYLRVSTRNLANAKSLAIIRDA